MSYFKMDKARVISWLTKLAFLLPGSLKRTKYWFLNPWTILSLVGLGMSLINGVLEFIHCPPLEPSSKEEGQSPSSDGCNEQIDHSENDRTPPSTVVLIVLACRQIFTFFINFLVRLLVMISFPKIRALIECLNSSTDKRTYLKRQRWLRAWIKWSTNEKVFLVIFITAVFERQVGVVITIEDLFHRRCPFFFSLVVLLYEQSKVWFSYESVLEIATLTLLAFVSTFVNLFEDACNDEMNYPTPPAPLDDSRPEILGKTMKIPQNLFIVAPNLNGNQKPFKGHSSLHWSDLEWRQFTKKSGQDFLEIDFFFGTLDSKIKKTHQTKKIEVGRSIEVGIHDEIEMLMGMYFETLSVWRHASGLTGFLTLILFVELTLTFCLNTFAGLAAGSEFGILDGRFLFAVLRGFIIIAKIVCVTHLAQALPDSTQLLADRILKLRWKSVEGNRSFLNKGVSDDDVTFRETNLSHVISYIASHPLNLSALGYFQVTKSLLTTITGVIVTYLVVLVQFHVQIIQTSKQNITSA